MIVMREIFNNISRFYGNEGYYEIFFENPDEEPGAPDKQAVN